MKICYFSDPDIKENKTETITNLHIESRAGLCQVQIHAVNGSSSETVLKFLTRGTREGVLGFSLAVRLPHAVLTGVVGHWVLKGVLRVLHKEHKGL